MILEEDGVRIVLRDSGGLFSLSDTNASPETLRQYVASVHLNLVTETKRYLAAMGFNQNEFYILNDQASACG